MVNEPKFMRTINGVGPARGEVGALGGRGITIIDNPASNTITWENAGINEIVAGPGITAVTDPDGVATIGNAGIIQNVAGAGIAVVTMANGTSTISNTGVLSLASGNAGVSVDMATGAVSVSNTGVLSVSSGGPGISVNASTGALSVSNDGVHSLTVPTTSGLAVDMTTGAVTANHEVSRRTLALGAADADGTHVVYNVDVGFFPSVPANTWRVSIAPGFTPLLFPGAVDGGAGTTVGNNWVAPAPGLYSLSADCEVYPSEYTMDAHQSVSVVAVLGASDVDPYAAGYIPAGAQSTLDVSSGNTAGPAVPSHISFSSIFQVCADCPVTTGAALTLHVRQDTVGSAATVDASCRLQVTQVV